VVEGDVEDDVLVVLVVPVDAVGAVVDVDDDVETGLVVEVLLVVVAGRLLVVGADVGVVPADDPRGGTIVVAVVDGGLAAVTAERCPAGPQPATSATPAIASKARWVRRRTGGDVIRFFPRPPVRTVFRTLSRSGTARRIRRRYVRR
jgi:hypothetical protein